MLFDYNQKFESANYVDGIEFTSADPCIWNVYPAGAAGDLLACIINAHYVCTGSNYFGINENGQVIFRPSDYKIINRRHESGQCLFDKQFFYDISESLGSRNLNYSLLDQFIFSCHMHSDHHVDLILSTFSKAMVIRTKVLDAQGQALVRFQSELKNRNRLTELRDARAACDKKTNTVLPHARVLELPFGWMFSEDSYYRYYDQLLEFLGLKGRLICYDFVQYYITKQHSSIQRPLIEYAQRL